MKFYYLCLTIIPFFISCSDSSNLELLARTGTTTKAVSLNQHANRGFEDLPTNIANPYDIAGQLHNELYEAYYAADSLSTGVEGISSRISQIAKENSSFVSLAGPNYSFLSNNRIVCILATIDTCTEAVMAASLMTAQAQTSLSTFISSLLVLCESETDYGIIYQFVVAYEDSILTNSTLNARDMKIILTTTSIARHSVYERKKRPKKNTDPEWDLMVGNIVAGTDGSTESLEKAIMMSVIAGIAENE